MTQAEIDLTTINAKVHEKTVDDVLILSHRITAVVFKDGDFIRIDSSTGSNVVTYWNETDELK